MWIICTALIAVVLLTLNQGAEAGALALASLLVIAGITRAALRGTLVGITVRSKAIDLTLYFGIATLVIFLAETAPGVS